ncbi:phenol hydroxylase [Arthrobacter crystallopoietes BAB-32]|uniref:Phenol hydroxylase n=1 Tax=Arthrobacter crystallopoietes BAB-32 TaxID=1246476 RepID=N1UYX5_9MICC|nr:phenol hydroxylase [Arthrobacter crystallopoietes BAB-32]
MKPPVTDLLKGRFAVVSVDQDAVRQRLQPLPDPLQLGRDRGVAFRAEAQLKHLAGGVLVDQRGGRAFGHDPALVHDDQPVAELLGLVHVVRGEHQRDALLLESEEPVPEDVPRLRVQAGGGLVQQQDLRLVDQRAGDGQPALHAAGERVHAGLGLVGELGELQQLVRLRPQVAVGQAEVAAVDDQVVADPDLVVEVVLLRHHAQVRPDLGAVAVRIQPHDGQLARGALRDAADHPHCGRLAGAVGPEQAEGLPRRDVEGDAVDRGEIPVLLGQAARRNDGLGQLFRDCGVGHSTSLWQSRD